QPMVWRWRKALGVTRTNNAGTHKLMVAASAKGADETRGKPLPPEICDRRREAAYELNIAARLTHGYHGEWWSEEELALLGTMPDEEVAARIGRTVEAVRIKRNRSQLPKVDDRRRRR